jgi:hypothetical protein
MYPLDSNRIARYHRPLFERHEFRDAFASIDKSYCVVVDELACTRNHWTMEWHGDFAYGQRTMYRDMTASEMRVRLYVYMSIRLYI